MQTYQTRNPLPPLKEEARLKMIEESNCLIMVDFHDQSRLTKPGTQKYWSKCGQRKFINMNEAINDFLNAINYGRWRGKVKKAAIYDTRIDKNHKTAPKIYQYENGFWTLLTPVSW